LTKIGEVAEVQHGWAFKGEYADASNKGEPRLIRIGNFAGSRGDVFRPSQAEGYKGPYPKRFELDPGNLLIAMTCQTSDGSILGWPMRVPDDGVTYLHNQRIGRVVVKDNARATLDYLEYLFRAAPFNDYLFQTASGSKILHTAPTRIEDFEFELPPLDEQRRIAEVLGALDDLIDTNERLVRSLRTLQAAIVTESQSRASREVPFGEIAMLNRAKSTGGPETPYLGLEHFAENGGGVTSIGRLGAVSSAQQSFSRGDVLYGRLRPYFRKVDRPGFDGACSGEIWVIRPVGGVPVSVLGAIVSAEEFTDFAMAGSEGTKMPRTKWDHVSRFKVRLPDQEALTAMAQSLDAMW
jgi:type I restriction enzyme S subunit